MEDEFFCLSKKKKSDLDFTDIKVITFFLRLLGLECAVRRDGVVVEGVDQSLLSVERADRLSDVAPERVRVGRFELSAADFEQRVAVVSFGFGWAGREDGELVRDVALVVVELEDLGVVVERAGGSLLGRDAFAVDGGREVREEVLGVLARDAHGDLAGHGRGDVVVHDAGVEDVADFRFLLFYKKIVEARDVRLLFLSGGEGTFFEQNAVGEESLCCFGGGGGVLLVHGRPWMDVQSCDHKEDDHYFYSFVVDIP